MQAETAALVMTYQMPTATLDTSNIDQVRADAQARLDELNLDWLPDLLSDAVTRLRTRLDDGGLPDDSGQHARPAQGAAHGGGDGHPDLRRVERSRRVRPTRPRTAPSW